MLLRQLSHFYNGRTTDEFMCRGERGGHACKTRLASRLLTGARRIRPDHSRIPARQFADADGRESGGVRGDGRTSGDGHGVGRVLLIDGGGSMRRALIDSEIATTAAENEWEGIVCYGCVREVDILEDLDIGIQALAAIPVGADSKDIGETDLPVNFGGVTFLPDDHLYADTTGVILSPDALDIE